MMLYKSPVKTFIIYSREDAEYLYQLNLHLKMLMKSDKIKEIWSDGKIMPGEEWDSTIKQKLNEADVILLLISVNFFNSDYIEKEELRIAFKRHEEARGIVIPILVRPCLWKAHKQIQSLQILPRSAEPVSSWNDSDEAFTIIAHEIDQAIDGLYERKRIQLETLLNAAIVCYNTNRYDDAYNTLVKVLPTGLPLDSEAAFVYAKIMATPLGSIQRNDKLAFEWYTYSANLGNAKAQNNLACMYSDGIGVLTNIQTAIYWYQKSAEGGDLLGCYNIANLYYFGTKVKQDYNKAAQYYLSAAQNGYAPAQYYLSIIYLNGFIGDGPDIHTSLSWLQKAIDQKYTSAQVYWAAILLEGKHTEKDVESAMYWLNLAAAEDNQQSLYILGELNYRGIDIPQNLNSAIQYFRKASALGSDEARQKLNELGT